MYMSIEIVYDIVDIYVIGMFYIELFVVFVVFLCC